MKSAEYQEYAYSLLVGIEYLKTVGHGDDGPASEDCLWLLVAVGEIVQEKMPWEVERMEEKMATARKTFEARKKTD
jgi:hypothetical protein